MPIACIEQLNYALLEESHNIYNWMVVCGLICRGKQQSQQILFSSRRGECMYKKKKYVSVNSPSHNLDASF